MNRRFASVIVIALLTLLLLSAVAVMAQESDRANPNAARSQASLDYTYTTVITVTSGTDPDTSKSYICSSPPADGLCTLRRAIVEARGLSAGELPVLISFDIPADPAHGYVAGDNLWRIEVQSTNDPSVFRRLTGDIIIDGSTQSGGRSSGPKIVIAGPTTGQKDGLIVGDSLGDDNIQIYHLAFQNFKTHLHVNTDDNIIEGNWFGLNNAGTAPYLRDDDPEDGSGSSAIALASGSANNVVRDNVFLGFDGVAVAVRGEGNLFENNLVGTKADGTVDKQTDPNLVCTTVDWLGGGGVSVEGDSHEVSGSVFAGLRQEIFAISTQPSAIKVDGDNHVVQNNKIGVDGSDNEVGVCGRGIYLSGADTPDHTEVLSNTIVNPEMSAISINGLTTDANTLQNNVVKKSSDWPEIAGNPEPEAAIQFGPSVPNTLRDFNPARVTTIDGTAVSGSSGVGSPCPNCVVELFLDDTDAVTEALQFLGRTVANGSGNWSLTLPFALSGSQGLRTTSTTAQYNTIAGMSAGTTTELSELYTADFTLFLPMVSRH